MAKGFAIKGFDHVHYWVGNAKQAAHYYQSLFGFEPIAYSGLETGQRQTASYVLRQNKITLVFSTPLISDHPMQKFLAAHGDSVRDIAFSVDDVDAAFTEVCANGADPVAEPEVRKNEFGEVKMAAVRAYGDTIHTFIDRSAYRGIFLPGYEAFTPIIPTYPVGLVHIDHIVGNQPENEMERVVNYYQSSFGFHRFWTVDDEDISTEYSSLRSIVVANENEIIKMPINEPAPGLRKSQIQEYIDFNAGAGVQHIAMSTRDIVATIRQLRHNGVSFLPTPDSYYDTLPERTGNIDESIVHLRQLGILVDRDADGYMLQIFTKPVEDRPTLFLEVIQRKGSNSFGKGNFKALFESIEREQHKRGNL
jgi:4-hydroxyphenylpyruvate dioxygenase